MKKGYDISHWAGDINWMQVGYENPDWLCFKSSDGNHESGRYAEHFDSRLIENWERSHKYIRGISIDIYHWYANPVPVAEQIALHKYVLDHLDPIPNRSWLDLEEKTPGGSWASVKKWLDAFLTAGVYTSPGALDWFTRNWGKCPPDVAQCLASRKLWLAWYPYILDLSKPPKAPGPWTKWDVWQVNKNHKVPGIPGGVSLDVME